MLRFMKKGDIAFATARDPVGTVTWRLSFVTTHEYIVFFVF